MLSTRARSSGYCPTNAPLWATQQRTVGAYPITSRTILLSCSTATLPQRVWPMVRNYLPPTSKSCKPTMPEPSLLSAANVANRCMRVWPRRLSARRKPCKTLTNWATTRLKRCCKRVDNVGMMCWGASVWKTPTLIICALFTLVFIVPRFSHASFMRFRPVATRCITVRTTGKCCLERCLPTQAFGIRSAVCSLW